MRAAHHWFRLRKTGFWLLLATSAIVAAYLGVCEIQANVVSFDGALNAQVAANLVKSGRYGIGYPDIQDFDHRVQTGPTVVLPVAVSFRIFGVGNAAAQLPNLIYFVEFLIFVVVLAFRYGGPVGALLAVVLVLQTPQLVPFALGVFGEIPALVFLLAALLLLDRLEEPAPLRTAVATGFLLGLSVLTKVVMLIPVFAVLLAIVVAVAARRSIRLRVVAGVCAGLTVPLAVFEAAKLAVLSPPIWWQWWTVMIHRIAGQGLPLGMDDTVGSVPKLQTHIGILIQEMDVSAWPVLLLIGAPTLLLALLGRQNRVADRPAVIPLSVLALWLAASTFLAWWLLLTPTSRAWLRRILDGLLLQEILASILLVWAARAVICAFRSHRLKLYCGTVRFATAGALACLLFLAVGTLAASGLPRLGMSMEPTPTRQSIDAMVAAMRSLPDDAVFYGKGWYRAPVFALLAEREMSDFNLFPVESYEKPLSQTYFVADNHMLYYRSGEVPAVLARTVNEPVYQSNVCALYRLDEVLPYAPLPEPEEDGVLRASLSPKDGDYPFAAGLGPAAPRGRYSHAVCGFLLDRQDFGCLLVDIWPSPEGGEKPRFEVRVDHQPVQSVGLVSGHPWRQVIVLGEDSEPDTPGSLVELWMFAVRDPGRFSLWSSDKDSFVVREVGFVPCPEPEK